MKKVMIVIAASLMFAACGAPAEQPATDSTTVDSTVAVDTTAQAVDTASAK